MPTLQPTPNPRKTRRLRVLFFVSMAVLILPLVAGRGRRQNWERTRPDHPETILRTRYYQAGVAKDSRAAVVAKVNRAVVKAISELKTYGGEWRIQSNDGENIRVEVPVLFFTDDLVVTIRAHEEVEITLKVPQSALKAQNMISVDVRSTSRVGKGDFGENRRHVLQLLDALDRTLEKSA